MPKLKEIALKKLYCEKCGEFLGSVILGGFIKCNRCSHYTEATVLSLNENEKFTRKVSGIKSAVLSA